MEKDVDTSVSNPKDEPGKGVNFKFKPRQVSKSKTEKVVLDANRVFVGEDVLGGTLPKNTYQRLLTSKFTVAGCLKIMKVIVKYM